MDSPGIINNSIALCVSATSVSFPGGVARDLWMESLAQLIKMEIADFTPSYLYLYGLWNATEAQQRNMGLKSIIWMVAGTLAHLFAWFLACWVIIVCRHDPSRNITCPRN